MSTPPSQRKGSLLGTIKAVGWAFFGVRKNRGYREDLARLNPLHIIFVAFAGVIVFVGGLILLIRFVVAP